jgi:hypothetical protein
VINKDDDLLMESGGPVNSDSAGMGQVMVESEVR